MGKGAIVADNCVQIALKGKSFFCLVSLIIQEYTYMLVAYYLASNDANWSYGPKDQFN